MKKLCKFIFLLTLAANLIFLFTLTGCSNKDPESSEPSKDFLLTSTTSPEDMTEGREIPEISDSFSRDSEPTTVRAIADIFPKPKKAEKETYKQTVESTTKTVTTTTQAAPQVVDCWDSTFDIYSLLDDGTVLRGETPIKNDASYALNTSFRTILFWLEDNEGDLSESVLDEAMVYLIDSAAISIFDGKLKREEAHIYVDNARVAFVEKLKELGYSNDLTF